MVDVVFGGEAFVFAKHTTTYLSNLAGGNRRQWVKFLTMNQEGYGFILPKTCPIKQCHV